MARQITSLLCHLNACELCSRYTHHTQIKASLQQTYTACLLYSVTLDATQVIQKSPPISPILNYRELNYWIQFLFLQELTLPLASTHLHIIIPGTSFPSRDKEEMLTLNILFIVYWQHTTMGKCTINNKMEATFVGFLTNKHTINGRQRMLTTTETTIPHS